MNIVLWVAQGLAAIIYLMAGSMKAFNTAKTQESMPWARDSTKAKVRFIGTAELLGAIGIVLPLVTGILPWVVVVAALALSLVQVLAIFTTHVPRKEFQALPMNIAFLALTIFVAIGRFYLFSS